MSVIYQLEINFTLEKCNGQFSDICKAGKLLLYVTRRDKSKSNMFKGAKRANLRVKFPVAYCHKRLASPCQTHSSSPFLCFYGTEEERSALDYSRTTSNETKFNPVAKHIEASCHQLKNQAVICEGKITLKGLLYFYLFIYICVWDDICDMKAVMFTAESMYTQYPAEYIKTTFGRTVL